MSCRRRVRNDITTAGNNGVLVREHANLPAAEKQKILRLHHLEASANPGRHGQREQ